MLLHWGAKVSDLMHLDTFEFGVPSFNGEHTNQVTTISGTLKRYSGNIAFGDVFFADDPKTNMAYLVLKVVRSPEIKSYTTSAMVTITNEEGEQVEKNVLPMLTWDDYIVIRMDVAEKRPGSLKLTMTYDDEDGAEKSFYYQINTLNAIDIDPIV